MKNHLTLFLLLCWGIGCSTIEPANLRYENDAKCLESINHALETIADARSVKFKPVSLSMVRELRYGRTLNFDTKHKETEENISHVYGIAKGSDGKCKLALVQETNKGKDRAFGDYSNSAYKTKTNTVSGIETAEIPNCSCD